MSEKCKSCGHCKDGCKNVCKCCGVCQDCGLARSTIPQVDPFPVPYPVPYPEPRPYPWEVRPIWQVFPTTTSDKAYFNGRELYRESDLRFTKYGQTTGLLTTTVGGANPDVSGFNWS